MKQLLVSLETAAKALDMPLDVFVLEVLPALDIYHAAGVDYVRPDDLEQLIHMAFSDEKEAVVVELFPVTDD